MLTFPSEAELYAKSEAELEALLATYDKPALIRLLTLLDIPFRSYDSRPKLQAQAVNEIYKTGMYRRIAGVDKRKE